MRRILGVDPGFGNLGWAVVEYADGTDKVLEMGVITTKPSKNKGVLKTEDAFKRLRETSEKLFDLSLVHGIDAVAFESLSIPPQTSKQNAIKIGHPYGILAGLCVANRMAAVQLTPQAIKKEVCGTISASKEAVQAAIRARFSEQAAATAFAQSVPKSLQNHGWDALAAYVASGGTEVMRALKRDP